MYFALLGDCSEENNEKTLKEIHISLVLATTNMSILKKDRTGSTNILIKEYDDIKFDSTVKGDYDHYIII